MSQWRRSIRAEEINKSMGVADENCRVYGMEWGRYGFLVATTGYHDGVLLWCASYKNPVTGATIFIGERRHPALPELPSYDSQTEAEAAVMQFIRERKKAGER